MTLHDHSFRAMGSDVRVLHPDPAAAEAATHAFAERLTRFEATSELSRLNADPRARVPVSPTLRTAVMAALWAARLTNGLVDPTLAGAIERAGYRRSLTGADPADLRAALRGAPDRRPAGRGREWRRVRVRGTCVERPPGLRLDLGGTAKGLLADRLAAGDAAVDCGGDVRVGATARAIDVLHPLTGEAVVRLELRDAGVATSGIDRRIWAAGAGTAHHLLDPATGRPAWTGLIAATAIAPTALEAEALAKAALLSGPAGGRRWLAAHGGVLFHDDGSVERV
jgi:thiamine biosynthesis lipoprotein